MFTIVVRCVDDAEIQQEAGQREILVIIIVTIFKLSDGLA